MAFKNMYKNHNRPETFASFQPYNSPYDNQNNATNLGKGSVFGGNPGTTSHAIPQNTKTGGIGSDWGNPFDPTSKGYSGSRGSSGGSSGGSGGSSGDYGSGMSNLKSIGGNISGLGNTLSGFGSTLASRFASVFNPAITKAQEYADVNPQDMVDQASLDVGSSYDKAAGIQSRNISRYGISPNSGKAQGQMLDLNLMRAASEAGARNKSRIQARDISFGRNMQIAGMGQGLANQAISAYGQAGNAFGSAANVNSNLANQAWKYNQGEGALAGYNKLASSNSTSTPGTGAKIREPKQGSQFNYDEQSNFPSQTFGKKVA